MLNFSELPSLSEADRSKISELAQKLEEFCSAAGAEAASISLDYFLPAPDHPLRVPTIWCLIPRDLRRHWQNGIPLKLEEYVARYPELVDTRQIPAALIFEEYLVRKEVGESPSLDEYQARFPEQYDSFRRRTLAYSAEAESAEAESTEAESTEAESAGAESAEAHFDEARIEPPSIAAVEPDDALQPRPGAQPSDADSFATYHAPGSTEDVASAWDIQSPDGAESRVHEGETRKPGLDSTPTPPQGARVADETGAAPPVPPLEITPHRGSDATDAFAPPPSRDAAEARELSPSAPTRGEHRQLRVGDTVCDGKYRLARYIDKGQYGQVWEAEAQGGVRVALKIIQYPLGHEMSQEELRSLESMKAHRHSHLVQVHAYWVEHDQLMIAMSLADNTLAGRLKECQKANTHGDSEGGIPPDELVGYIIEAAKAIDFLHSRGIMHRDIKPANILLVSGTAQVGDFGLAKVLERHSEASLAQATVIGTPMYMAPEIFQGRLCEQTDQYALAVTYAQLRTGIAPFPTDSLAVLMHAQLTMPPNLKGLEPKERLVLVKALAKNPKQRYATCQEFAQSLKRSLEPEPYPWFKRALQAMAAVATVLLVYLALHQLFWRFEIDLQPAVTVRAGGAASVFLVPVTTPLLGSDAVQFEVKLLPPDDAATPGSELPSPEWVFEPPTGDSAATHRVSVRVKLPTREANRASVTRLAEMVARSGSRVASGRFRLVILPPAIVDPKIPPEFTYQPAPEIAACSNGRIHPRSFTLRTPREQAIEFRLVDDGNGKPFYLMTNKVWNALFAEFAENPDRSKLLDEPTFWRTGAITVNDYDEKFLGVKDDAVQMFPVFQVSIFEAKHFAQWLGGHLPSILQWEAAAKRGMQDQNRKGPYDPSFDLEHLDRENPADCGIAISREKFGPLPVGTARFDQTPDGIRDLAGNGYEWTRSVTADYSSTDKGDAQNIESIDASSASQFVGFIGGMSYQDGRPDEFSQESPLGVLSLEPGAWQHGREMVTFRVVMDQL